MQVTVCVATYGDESWRRLAEERALPSARAQGVAVIHAHHPRGTLAEARNDALAMVTTERVVFLDADDELEDGYLARLMATPADLVAPAVRYVRDRPLRPRVPRVAGHRHACSAECLRHGNYLVIGSLAPTEMVRRVGGFREWPMYEDWDLWLRCWHVAGASVASEPAAVYRAHVRPDSRNRAPDMAVKNEVHRMIVDDVLGGRVGSAAYPM